jgi:hypothetical protein
MTKSIHIARPEVHEMAKELARLKGTTIVAAVSEALRNRLDEVRAQKNAGTYVKRPSGPPRHNADRFAKPRNLS